MFVRSLVLLLAAAGLMLPVAAAPASASPDHYTPRPGPTFNNPIGSHADKRRIYRQILRSIDSTKRGSNINIFSWNFLTQTGKKKLIRAQHRGVRVRLIMDDRNLTEIDNPPFRQLRHSLRHYNHRKSLPGKRRSWARFCRKTCRSTGGSAHSKFYMFSEAGNARRVVMQGSANFTVASSTNQWNDITTHTRNRKVWDFYTRVFKQASHDRPVHPPYAQVNTRSFKLMQFPIQGKNVRDPVMQMLRRVRCKGATNTPHHKTRLQIAPDVLRQKRGMRLAQKLRRLWDHGCKVRIGYTVVGKDVGRMLRADTGRGPVPMKHLVQDFNGDGQFDNYFHLKAMVIRGHYGKDHSGFVLLNGSANWSGLAAHSDENVGIYRNRHRVVRYLEHLDYWYDNFPTPRTTTTDSSTPARVGAASGADGSSDAGSGEQLIFGSGKNAVYENGESVTDGEYDPFAQIQTD